MSAQHLSVTVVIFSVAKMLSVQRAHSNTSTLSEHPAVLVSPTEFFKSEELCTGSWYFFGSLVFHQSDSCANAPWVVIR